MSSGKEAEVNLSDACPPGPSQRTNPIGRMTDLERIYALQDLSAHLLLHEVRWSKDYDFFLQRGYRLPSRLRPGWVPSWEGTDLHPDLQDDGYPIGVRILFSVPCMPLLLPNHFQLISDTQLYRCHSCRRRACCTNQKHLYSY